MKKKIVLSDLDSTAANLPKKWLGRYNVDHDDSLTEEDLLSWDIGSHTKIGKERMEEYLLLPNFFDDLEPIPGAIENLTRLHEEGFHVIVLSSPFGADSARAKITWARHHMPFLSRKDIMLGHHKELVYGHFLIDDSPKQLTAWTEQWSHGLGLTLEYKWNAVCKGKPRIEHYAGDQFSAWTSIADRIIASERL